MERDYSNQSPYADSAPQRRMLSRISTNRKLLMLAGLALLGYALLVSIFLAFLIASPVQTAKLLGIVKNRIPGLPNTGEVSGVSGGNSTFQTLLQPISRVSLGLLKSISPNSYEQVAKEVILDTNDIIGLNASGAIIPRQPISLPESSLLQVGSNGLIENLNSQYLQGKQPGNNPGDIAIVGESAVPGLPETGLTPVPVQTISGLTNANLSGTAGIANANLANPSVTVNTSGPLSGGGTVSLGSTLTLSCPTCATSGGSAFTADSTDTLTNKTINIASNTITGLTAGNLTAGDFSSKINSGTYSINISGSAGSFGGSFSGDVTGTQASTTVGKINGATLGTTTATSGNLLLADGSSWITRALSGDATINSSGVLTLKNTGTAGTYGSVSSIPVLTTDAQGRVSGVTNTAISGLTVSSFGSANISQWTNDSSYITSSSTDTLTNKTLTSPTINGTVATTGLTLPGLTIAGNITGSGSPTITNFGTINGLTFTPNATGFSVAGGTTSKALTVANALTFAGTDSTTITFQGTDIYVGRATTDTLTNKTISAGSNTISGLSNANLSGTAGITNANLANSSFATSGNSGSGSVALGGTLTLTGAGITSVTAGGSTLTLTSTEADTLQSVYGRGNTITTTTGDGIIVDSSGATVVGTINGLKINAPTTIPAAGTYNSLSLGTSTSTTANSYDQATIAVGNSTSTAQNNFSTLNITNGGTGFLDVELIRGFINFQGMNTLYDDFTSRILDITNNWTSTPTGAGTTCAVLGGSLNGLLRMHSGAGINRGCELSTQLIGSLFDGYYQRSNNPILETKLKIDIVANARIFVGFTEFAVPTAGDTNPDTNHAYIAKRATDTTWQCVTDDGGPTETFTSTGVTIVAGTFYRLRVELRNGTTPQTICTIDDGTTVTRTVVTATQPLAASPMDIYVKLNQSDAVVKNMDVDYVRAWQDDPPLVLNTEGNLALSPSTDDGIASEEEVTSETTQASEEETVLSDSENLPTLIAASINGLFKKLVEFFDNVIFHADTTFLGRTTFNKDTAGHAAIKAGDSETNVTFEKEYPSNPVVTANANLSGEVKQDEVPTYAIYDLSTKGFKIKLSKVITFDLNFSWVALFVLDSPILSPTPTAVPSPIQETVPSPTPDESASPSASTP